MACLFLIRDHLAEGDAGPAPGPLAAARASLVAQGYADPVERRVPGWRMLHAGPMLGGMPVLVERGEDFLAVAGTMSVDGRIDTAALQAALGAGPDLSPERIGGQFAAVMHRGGRTFVLTDPLATFQLFRDGEDTLFSTSLLAAIAALPRVSLDTQGVYEFAFNVVPVGDRTIIEQLSLVGPQAGIELTRDGLRRHPRHPPRIEAPDPARPMTERLARARDRLMTAVEGHVAAFGDAIQCPLSGGFDSRLVLAALRAAGARPQVYVYGPPDRADVGIARAIGKAEGFEVNWINKGAIPAPEPEALAEHVAANFLASDALPNFGNIFDGGGDAFGRAARHAGGALAVSGGGGEIYRDFFRLPDRPLPAMAVARAFFSRFAASDATELFEPVAFRTAIRDAVLAALGTNATGPLPRHMLELAYPRLRCRSLFGRELSLEARLSPYLIPFLDHRVVAEAMTLPMALKQAGGFQSRLIAAIDPALARHPSTYGHDFAGPPNRAHRRSEWSSRHRPLWLRERAYALRRRLGPMDDEHGVVDRAAIAHVMDTSLPLMRRYFHVDGITDSGLWRRVACLEYLAQWLGSKLVTSSGAAQPAERSVAIPHIPPYQGLAEDAGCDRQAAVSR